MPLLKAVAKIIDQHRLIEDNQKLLVALSGGTDSVCLLHLLRRFASRRRWQLVATHINHLIRPRNAERDQQFCEELCKQWKIPLIVETYDIPALARTGKTGLEETAREIRYQVFEQLARQEECDRIVLGHHADDQAETVLFRIIRGTGINGLAGIPRKRGRIVRPLLEFTRIELEEYRDHHDLPYREDETNAQLTYDRNYIRHKLLPQIRKRLNPRINRSLVSLAEIAAIEVEALDARTDKALAKVRTTTPGGKIELAIDKLTRYDRAIRRRVLRRCVAELLGEQQGVDKVVISRLESLLEVSARPVALPGRTRAERIGQLVVMHHMRRARWELPIVSRRTRLPGMKMSLVCRPQTYDGEAIPRIRRARQVTVDKEKLSGSLSVRTVKDGDRFVPFGMTGTKKIGDYLTDRKIPAVYRDEIPVVCDQKGIIWLAGFEIAERVKVDRATQEVMRLEIIRHKR
ncbi:tRNA lysidine(34) synthetase TilS [candidate division GN15 bacterium]|nr:tRNA lysidine(34) synthetase TilS [candidate division GN15 bacterium]